MSKITFNKKSVFFNTLKSNVDEYFTTNNIKKTGNWKLYSKAIILIPSAIIIYIALLSTTFEVVVALSLCSLLGLIIASIGFNVMHDACHGSYSSKKWVNDVVGLSLNALGGNAFIWKFKHNIIHHTYTNVDGIDDDIAKSPIIRQCSTQKWVPAHRFQHLYVIFVYAISYAAWVFLMDFTKYFKQKINSTPLQKMSRKEHIVFWVSKALYALFYVAIPIYFVGAKQWAIGYAVMEVTVGVVLALVFQLAHVVEHAEFEIAGINPKQLENEWAAHQVKTTSNFAPENSAINWYVGGLNFQVEHHLFPRISHVHYPAISKIVKQTCEEFNLPYNTYPTMSESIASHFRMMKKLGEKPPELIAA